MPWVMLALGAAAVWLLMRNDDDDNNDALPAGWTWTQLSRSGTATKLGLDNTPTPEARGNLARLIRDVLQPLRVRHPTLRINSAYRSRAVNTAIGGSKTSDHPTGRAVDFAVPGMDSRELAQLVLALGLPYDQLIWYHADRGGHVHIGHRGTGRNRRQVLYAPSGGGYEVRRP